MSLLKAVNILFKRCYYGENSFNESLRLIKIVGNKEDNIINVIGEDSGIDVDWCFVINENSLDYDVGDWENIVINDGYFPVQETESSSESINEDNNNNGSSKEDKEDKSNTWMILAIVFIVAFVVAIVVLIIVFIIKRKKFDRSENEN